MSWQPIATAPRNGTAIIVFDAHTETPQCWIVSGCTFDDGSFSWTDFGAHPVEVFSPTHWMPLPEPPNG